MSAWMRCFQVIIVEECMKTGGIGASLSSQISETYMDFLDSQVRAQNLSLAARTVDDHASQQCWHAAIPYEAGMSFYLPGFWFLARDAVD